MKENIILHLLSLASLNALIGQDIYTSPAPVGKKKYVIIYKIGDGISLRSNAGLKGATKNLFQIDSYAELESEAEAIKEAIRRGLDGYSGIMGTATVYSCVKSSTRGLDEIKDDSSETGIFRKSLDFDIVHSEATEDLSTTTTTTTT